MMLALLAFKTLSLLFEAVRYHVYQVCVCLIICQLSPLSMYCFALVCALDVPVFNPHPNARTHQITEHCTGEGRRRGVVHRLLHLRFH